MSERNRRTWMRHERCPEARGVGDFPVLAAVVLDKP